MAHVTVDLLFASWTGELPRRDLDWLAYSHLVQLCPVCAREYAKFARVQRHLTQCLLHPQVDTSEQAGELIHQLEGPEPLSDEEKAPARRWLRELERLPYEAWDEKVERARTRFRGPAFADVLLDEARAATPDNPQRAFACAAIAQQVAARFHPERPELYALSIAHQANSLRIQSDYQAAGARASVLHLVLQEVDQPLALAEIGSLLGSYFMDVRRFGHARTELRRALAFYSALNRPVLATKTQIKLANVEYYAGDTLEAIKILESIESFDLAEQPQLRLVIQLNLAMMRCALGNARAADQTLQQLGPWVSHLPPRLRLNYRWITARVAAGLGHRREALGILEELQGTYSRMGLDYCCALIALDIAIVHLDQGEIEEALLTVGQVVDDLERFHLGPDALAWAEELRLALGRRAITVAFLRSRLRHLEHVGQRLRKAS